MCKRKEELKKRKKKKKVRNESVMKTFKQNQNLEIQIKKEKSEKKSLRNIGQPM